MSCLYLVKLFTLQNFKNYSSITFFQIKLFHVPIFPTIIELDMISEILGYQYYIITHNTQKLDVYA